MATFSRFATEETLSLEEVRDLIAGGKIAATDLLSRDGSSECQRANEYVELRAFFFDAPRVRREPSRIFARFEPKFSEEDGPSTLIERFIGLWFLGGAAWVYMDSFAGGVRPGDVMPLILFGCFGIAGIALLLAPAKIREFLGRRF